MITEVSGIDAATKVGNLPGPVGYLVAHPLVRFICAATAFTTSLYAIRRSMRAATDLKRAGWVVLASLTAAEGVDLVLVPAPPTPSPTTELSVAA
jgi:hypothetical protein